MFSWRITWSESDYSQWANRRPLARLEPRCGLLADWKEVARDTFFTQSMPRTRRDTAASAKEDTFQVVENERPCTWYVHQVQKFATMFMMKTMQARTVVWQRLLSSRKCQQLQEGLKKQVQDTIGGKASGGQLDCSKRGSSGFHEARQDSAFE